MSEKKPVLIFSAADQNNFPYAVMLFRSLSKFHPDLPMILFTNETRQTELSKLPKSVAVRDVTPYLDDPMFWYRQKPLLAEQFMDDYELVLGMDADQIVTGSLDYILNTKDYDVGTVINWNRSDPQIYGFVELGRIGIAPPEYFNCGLVAMRSKQFVHHWKVVCFTEQFNRMQYKEQDILNILCYFGNYNIRCFDHTDGVAKYYAWHGLIAKGELARAELRGTDIVVPKGEGDTPFPPDDVVIKVIHTGGGNIPNKLNYQGWFSDQKIVERITELVK
jgi:hypothetical protein